MDARPPVRRSGTPLTGRLRGGAVGLATRPPAALRLVLLGLALVLMATAVLAPRPEESMGQAGADSLPTDGVPDPPANGGGSATADRTSAPDTTKAAPAADATPAPSGASGPPADTSPGGRSSDTGPASGPVRQPAGGEPVTPPSMVPAAVTTAGAAPEASVPPAPARPWPPPGTAPATGSAPPAEPAPPTTSVPPLPALPTVPTLPTPSLPTVPAPPPLPEPEPPCVTPPLLDVRFCVPS